MKCPFCSTTFGWDNHPLHPVDCKSAPPPTEEERRQVAARHSNFRTEHREELNNEHD